MEVIYVKLFMNFIVNCIHWLAVDTIYWFKYSVISTQCNSYTNTLKKWHIKVFELSVCGKEIYKYFEHEIDVNAFEISACGKCLNWKISAFKSGILN